MCLKVTFRESKRGHIKHSLRTGDKLVVQMNSTHYFHFKVERGYYTASA